MVTQVPGSPVPWHGAAQHRGTQRCGWHRLVLDEDADAVMVVAALTLLGAVVLSSPSPFPFSASSSAFPLFALLDMWRRKKGRKP
jgi:hypothetical protein